MSLRRRLILGLIGLLVLALAVAGIVTYAALRGFLYNQLDQQLSATTVAATEAAGPGSSAPGPPGAPPGRAATSPRGGSLADALGGVLSAGELAVYYPSGRDAGDVVVTAPGPRRNGGAGLHAGAIASAFAPSDAAAAQPDPAHASVRRTVGGIGYLASATRLDGGTLVVAIPTIAATRTLHSLLGIEIAVDAAVVLALIAAAVAVVRRGLRPLDSIVETAGAISAGDRAARVPIEATDTEVGRVSAALNQMLDETEISFAAKDASEQRLRRFLADASHELRTPLASVASYTELLASGAAATASDRRLALARITGESTRMSRLVEELLLLARLDSGRPLRNDAVDLASLAEQVIADENTTDPQRRRSLHTSGHTTIRGDEDRLRQTLTNLLANARVHTPLGTSITVTMTGPNPPDEWLRLDVDDDGPGLDTRDTEQALEPFFRADPARHRPEETAGSGVGLGLAIVQAITIAHHGHIAVLPGPGGHIRIDLPMGCETAGVGVIGRGR
jgi:two-component system OmpR family sensor kinase